MSEGFPLLTIKKVPFKIMAIELEGFIKGITNKNWFQNRNCHIWDEWCNPRKVPYGNDEETKRQMLEEDDLGMIYGSQWRDFHDPVARLYGDGSYGSVDQLKNIINTLQKNPQDRRMICSAWNPLALDRMALSPCHVMFQVSVLGNKLNLSWFQRSVDVPLGLPFNIASYGLLLHLLAKIYGFEEGILTGFLNNVHFYNNQMEGVQEILGRTTHYSLPSIETKQCDSLFDWEHSLSSLKNYSCLPTVKMPIAV
jgi:thymidylate synthase